MEKTGTTGTTQDDDGLSDSQRKRKRSIWSKQKGVRRGSYDVVQSSRSDSLLTGIIDRKASTCTLDHDFFGEILRISFCKLITREDIIHYYMYWFLRNLTSAYNIESCLTLSTPLIGKLQTGKGFKHWWLDNWLNLTTLLEF